MDTIFLRKIGRDYFYHTSKGRHLLGHDQEGMISDCIMTDVITKNPEIFPVICIHIRVLKIFLKISTSWAVTLKLWPT